MKKTLVVTLMVAIAFGTAVGIVMAYSPHQLHGAVVQIWGSGPNEAIIDISGEINETDDEAFFQMTPAKGGFATDSAGTGRAEIIINRPLITNDDASAWLKGSGGGEVRVDEVGGVVIKLGT